VQQLYSHAKFGDDSYDDKANCEWSIEPAEGAGSAVRLTFLTFELEYEANCSYDRVEVFGGIDKNIPLGRFCNNSVITLTILLSNTEKNGFVTATKLGTTNIFFVAATKNFAAAT